MHGGVDNMLVLIRQTANGYEYWDKEAKKTVFKKEKVEAEVKPKRTVKAKADDAADAE